MIATSSRFVRRDCARPLSAMIRWPVERDAGLPQAENHSNVLIIAPGSFAAVHGPHARGPWFGALAVLVYAGVFGWVIRAPRRYDSWLRKHRELDAAFFGPRSGFE